MKDVRYHIVPHMSTGGLPAYVCWVIEEELRFRQEGRLVVVLLSHWEGLAYGVHLRKLEAIIAKARNASLTICDHFQPGILDAIVAEAESIYFHEDLWLTFGEKAFEVLEKLPLDLRVEVTSHWDGNPFGWLKHFRERKLTLKCVSAWQAEKARAAMREWWGGAAEFSPILVRVCRYPARKLREQDVEEQAKAFRDKVLGDDPGFIVLQVGLWAPHKNQGFTLRLAKELKAFSFLFAGNAAPNFADYHRPLRSALPANAHELGEMTEEQLHVLYTACDAVIVPSLRELHPICIREALAYGKPVIATALTSLREDYKDDGRVRLCAPDDPNAWEEAILNAVRSPDSPLERRADSDLGEWLRVNVSTKPKGLARVLAYAGRFGRVPEGLWETVLGDFGGPGHARILSGAITETEMAAVFKEEKALESVVIWDPMGDPMRQAFIHRARAHGIQKIWIAEEGILLKGEHIIVHGMLGGRMSRIISEGWENPDWVPRELLGRTPCVVGPYRARYERIVRKHAMAASRRKGDVLLLLQSDAESHGWREQFPGGNQEIINRMAHVKGLVIRRHPSDPRIYQISDGCVLEDDDDGRPLAQAMFESDEINGLGGDRLLEAKVLGLPASRILFRAQRALDDCVRLACAVQVPLAGRRLEWRGVDSDVAKRELCLVP